MEKNKIIACILLVACILSLGCSIKANASYLQCCPNCDKPVFSDYNYCPYCSYPLRKAHADGDRDKQHLAFAPVDLTSITPYYVGYIDVFTDGVTDTMGNYYRTGISGFGGEIEESHCFNIWDIGGKYNKLTATGIILEENRGSGYEGTCRIYGDGILLYERTNIDSMTKPYQVEVDISGVTDLKIELFGKVDMLDAMGAVLVDVMLLKTR